MACRIWINKTHFAKRIRYRQRLKEELKKRFRIEYLGQLHRWIKQKNDFMQIKVGDIVLIGNDTQKRLDWPLAVVKEIFPGKDGHVRVVKLKTEKGELIRPIQRLIPLEIRHVSQESKEVFRKINKETNHKIISEYSDSIPERKVEPIEEVELKTRSGRTVKKPDRYGF